MTACACSVAVALLCYMPLAFVQTPNVTAQHSVPTDATSSPPDDSGLESVQLTFTFVGTAAGGSARYSNTLTLSCLGSLRVAVYAHSARRV